MHAYYKKVEIISQIAPNIFQIKLINHLVLLRREVKKYPRFKEYTSSKRTTGFRVNFVNMELKLLQD